MIKTPIFCGDRWRGTHIEGVTQMIPRIKIALLGPNRIALDGLQRILTENGFDVLEAAVDADQLSDVETVDDDDSDVVHILLMDGLAAPRRRTSPANFASGSPAIDWR